MHCWQKTFTIDDLTGMGYNLNKSEKGVIYIILYHGTLEAYASDILRNGINLNKSKLLLDFGPGFYTTDSLKFAQNTGQFRAKRYNAFHPNHKTGWKVIRLVCDDNIFQQMRAKMFLSPDKEWGKFVVVNRCENKKVQTAYDNNIQKAYDIVSGPTADGAGTLTPILEQVNKGILSLEDIDYSCIAPSKNSAWGSQTSFHTLKSLSCITEISVL